MSEEITVTLDPDATYPLPEDVCKKVFDHPRKTPGHVMKSILCGRTMGYRNKKAENLR